MVNPRIHFFFSFFSHRGRWKKPPHNERLHSVAGAGGTAAPRLSENSMYRRGAFDIRLLFPNCVENYTVIRQKVNTCRFFFSTAGAGVNYFFWTLFRSVFLLMCIHVFAPSLPGWWLTAGWDVRGLLFTLRMTHSGMEPLILSPALWIKNTLWLTPRTLWPFESWQGRKRRVCHAEKAPKHPTTTVSAAEGQVAGKRFWAAFNI